METRIPKNEYLDLKRRWRILAFAIFFAGDHKFVGMGFQRVGRCPWDPLCTMVLDIHDDTFHVYNDAGFEVEDGDILDWYSKILKVDRATSAARLAAYQVSVPWN